MKKIVIFTSMFLYLFFTLTAQEKEPKNKLYLDIGTAYLPIDYVGGPSLGLTVINKKYDFGFTIRNDYMIRLERGYTYDTISTNFFGVNYGGQKIEIHDYYKLFYFDAFINLENYIHTPFSFGVGYGWINTNYQSNTMFNPECGYAVLSVKADYKISWLTLEIRGNIPIKKNYFDSYYPYNNLFPIEISAFYRFRPKKENE